MTLYNLIGLQRNRFERLHVHNSRVHPDQGAFKDQYIKGMLENAQESVNDEPVCLRFDVVQDANDENRIWLYEVYKDEAAFQAHTQTPHFIKFRDMSGDWREESGLQGAGRGATNIWPPDREWV